MGAVAALRDVDWAPRLTAATDNDVVMPSYYTRSFHAYPEVSHTPHLPCSPQEGWDPPEEWSPPGNARSNVAGVPCSLEI